MKNSISWLAGLSVTLEQNEVVKPAVLRPCKLASKGFSLVELLIGIMLTMLMLLGLYAIFIATKQTSTTQSSVATLQERQRLAMAIIANTVQSAGYYPDPLLQTAKVALPMSTPYTIAGQSVFAAQGGSVSTPDTLRARFQTPNGTSVMDCLGNLNTSGSRVRYDNVFTISGNALTCAVGANGSALGTAQTLVQGVSNLKVVFGIDPAPTTGSVVRYKDPSSMIASDWDRVLSVKVTLTFLNPQAGSAGQPATVTTTQVIQLAGES